MKSTTRAVSLGKMGFPALPALCNTCFLTFDEMCQLLELDRSGKSKVIKKSSEQEIDENDISDAKVVSFPTEDGQRSYGYFYPPVNSSYRAPQGEMPPVQVLVHGGPTDLTQPGFSKQLPFWTSQGYAVFDVNYRGSVGFGRKYRDALLKKWGILEIQDVKDGLRYLREQNLISDKAVVSGGSAGGYSVQRLLTYYSDLFSAGASHFGIGNLVTLQKLTHKYESHYLEQLIGGTLETNLREYEDRSPIRLKCLDGFDRVWPQCYKTCRNFVHLLIE